MDSSHSGSRKRAKTGRNSGTSLTRRTSAYDPTFKQHLIDHGIYSEGSDDEDSEEPANIEDINRRLAQPRLSLSPSRFTREQFLDFKKKNREALTESEVMSKVFPIIAGTANIPSQGNLRFTNLKDLTNGSITQAQPDFYDGARPEELNKQIRDELGPYIVPSTNTAAPCLPNFFTEGKGPKGFIDVAKNQAIYDGALGARGIHELRSYTDPDTAFDNNAYTITSTYHPNGLLTMYTTHPVESTNPKHPIEYRMTQLNSYAMTGNPDSFRQGAAAWRNGRDLTRDGRKELIAAANAKAVDAKALGAETSGLDSSTQSLVSVSSNELALPESETSADELALDLGIVHSSNHTTPVQARRKAPPKGSSNEPLKKATQIKKKPGMGSPI